jgi:hypothetical protein
MAPSGTAASGGHVVSAARESASICSSAVAWRDAALRKPKT